MTADDTTRAILFLLSTGHSPKDILRAHPTLTLDDVQAAAGEALRILESGESREDRIARVRARHPRAFEPWSETDDAELKAEFEGGASVAALARAFGRPAGAIRMRLAKLGVEVRRLDPAAMTR